MKKLRMMGLWVVLSFFPAVVFAQGIESGQSMVSLYGGFGSALQKSGLEMDNEEWSWGNVGVELGLSYLYFPTAYWGFGLDVHYAGFQGSEETRDVRGWRHWHTFTSDLEMNTLQLMAASRINLNPGSAVRVYIPFGAGIVFSDGQMRYKWDDEYLDYKDSSSDSSLGWYAGLGLEFDVNENVAWGFEARYNSFRYDYSGLADELGGRATGKDKEHNYVSFSVNVKFK